MQFFKGGTLLPAIGSPGGPEVQKNHLAVVIPYIDRLTLEVFQGELWSSKGFGIGLKNVLGCLALIPRQLSVWDPQNAGTNQSHQKNWPQPPSHLPFPPIPLCGLRICHIKFIPQEGMAHNPFPMISPFTGFPCGRPMAKTANPLRKPPASTREQGPALGRRG